MLKRCLSLMLALCLLATASSVAFMEESLEENAFEAVQITSDPVDQTVTDGEQDLDDLDEIASDPVITDAVPADEDVTIVDDVPVVDETPAADETPATDETPAADEAPAADETPAADEAPVADAVVADDETSAADEAVAAEAAPAAVEAEPVAVEEAADESAKAVAAEGGTAEFLFTKNARHTINVGDFLQLNMGGIAVKKFKSSKKGVATVNANGLIAAVGGGKTKITAVISKKKKLTLTLTVVDPAKPTGVSLAVGGVPVSGTYVASKGVAFTLTPVAIPATATVTGVKFKSSKKKIAKVNGAGVVTPKKVGTTVITVSVPRGGKKCKTRIKIKVIDPYKATKVTMEPSGFTYMSVGGRLQLTATMEPSYTTSTLKWTSSNKAVASVTKNGLVRAKKKGKATITVRTSSGKRARLTIQVLKKGGKAKNLFIEMASDEYCYVGELKFITARTTPRNANANVVWASSDPGIIEIVKSEHSGDLSWIASVVPKATGSCVITATDTVTGISSSITATVVEPPRPESITFPGMTGPITMSVGQRLDVEYKVNPSTSLSHTWNRAIVTYDTSIVSIDYAPNNADRNCLGTMDYKLHIAALRPGTTTVTVALRGNLAICNSFVVNVQ